MNKATLSKLTVSVAAALLVPVMTVAEETHVVGQQDKAFSIDEITINVGDTVEFRNDDDFFHNVFSLSDLKSFDLGSYPQGESKSVTFEEAGEVEVECAIHPSMFMTITVEE